MRKRLWMTMIIAASCGAGVEMHAADWASGIAMTNEAAFFDAVDLKRKELADVREAVAKEDWAAAKTAWGEYVVEHMLPRWMWSWRDLDKIEAYLTKRGAWDGNLEIADKRLRGEFHPSFIGHQSFLGDLARAYIVTKDPKYAEAWASLISNWIAENPVSSNDSRGAWHRLVTPARSSLWFKTMNQMVGSPVFDTELRYQMTRSLFEHARVLHRNPRLAGRLNLTNIHSGMANGLAMLAIMLPEAKESGDWWKLACIKVGEHMMRGVYPDGAYYELTPLYHYWVTDQFLTVMLLANKNGVDAQELFERHEKMYEYMMHISTPDRGWMPIADADDGLWKVPVAMTTAALLYGRPDMRYLGPDDVPLGGDSERDTQHYQIVWQFPYEKLAAYPAMPAAAPAFLSHMMPYAQYGVMRTGWHKQDRMLLVDYAPESGPHTHADYLQVLLYSGGRHQLLDLGSGPGYQSEDRPYYISEQAHNVLFVNGAGIGRKARPEVITWSIKPGAEFTSGKVASERRRKKNEKPFTQQRSVLFVKPDYWVVVDHVSGEQESPIITRRFHLPPNEAKSDAHAVRTTFEEGDNIWLHAADGASATVQFDVLPSGTNGANPVAVFEGQTPLPAALSMLLVPFSDEKQIPTVERVDSAGSETVALRVTFQDGLTDWITVAPTERELTAGKRSGSGMALCVRTDKDGEETAFELFGVIPLQTTASE